MLLILILQGELERRQSWDRKRSSIDTVRLVCRQNCRFLGFDSSFSLKHVRLPWQPPATKNN